MAFAQMCLNNVSARFPVQRKNEVFGCIYFSYTCWEVLGPRFYENGKFGLILREMWLVGLLFPSFLLGSEHMAEADVMGGDGSRTLCSMIAELFAEQDFKTCHHADLHAIPCKWRYINLLIPAEQPQVQLEETGTC